MEGSVRGVPVVELGGVDLVLEELTVHGSEEAAAAIVQETLDISEDLDGEAAERDIRCTCSTSAWASSLS